MKSTAFVLRVVFPLLTALVANAYAVAQLPIIELGAISRCGGRINSEFDLHVTSGSRHDEIQSLRFSHAGIVSKLKTDEPLPFNDVPQKKHGHFRVKIAENVPPGRYEVRAVGRHGVSNPRTFLVHDLPEHEATSTSHDRTAPTKLATGTLNHCKATASTVDYFQFDANDQQTLNIELFATQLDSRLLAHIDLYDASGRIIQSVQGSDDIDPQLVVVSSKAQTYTLAVYDAIYRGGDDYNYQLIVREADKAIVQLRVIPDQQRYVRLVGDYSNLIRDAEPIAETVGACSVDVPCQITADFDSRSDVDVYTFAAKEGDTFAIDLVSQRLGQPTDARLVVERSEPQQSGEPKWVHVATGDDAQSVSDAVIGFATNDPIVLLKAPKTTTYRILVRDLDTGTALGEKQRYWIDIRKSDPGFELVAYRHYPHKDPRSFKKHGSNLMRGGAESFRVFAIRRDGWAGPIQVSATGLPDGVTCADATIASGRDQVQMTLVASETAVTSIAKVGFVGAATIGEHEVNQAARAATLQWERGGQRDFHRVRYADDLVIAVTDQESAPIGISVGSGEQPIEIKRGASRKIPIRLRRTAKAKNECIVRPRDLPPNVTAGEVKIAKDKTDGELELKVNSKSKPGTYSLWLQTETRIKHAPNPEAMVRAKAYRDKLQTLRDDPTNKDKLDAIKAAVKIADARIEASKGGANDQDLTVYLPSSSITIRIVE